MLTKGKIYTSVQNITPPFMFRWFKHSSLYPSIVKIARKYTSTHIPEIIEIPDGDIKGFKLKCDPKGPWQHEMLSGKYDHELFEYLDNEETKGKIIYDIGAHIGYHTLRFTKYVGKSGHIFMFEPNPGNIKRIKEIIELNQNIKNQTTLIDVALSDTDGTTSFLSSDEYEESTSTGGFIDKATTIWTKETYTEKIGFVPKDIKTRTIDFLIKEKIILPPNILKIDVEGAEQLVLTGAKKCINDYHPTIIVELHSISSAYICMKILTEHNYDTMVLKTESDGRVLIAAKYLSV